ncbi:MAG: hypothetical protein H6742_22095 [Alphaproteobacteria bacterium]|nr:hypothetical protein [Alphaproteobacteria bacterium]
MAEFLTFLMGGIEEPSVCPSWPPDVFALAAAVLHRTGAYVRVVELLDGTRQRLLDDEWPAQAETVGKLWRQQWKAATFSDNKPGPVAVPEAVRSDWSTVWEHGSLPLDDLLDGRTRDDIGDSCQALCRALLRLVGFADHASRGIGISTAEDDSFLLFALAVLEENDARSLCREVHLSRLRVLPKQHTPQRGLTVRSLSHHLALLPASDVIARWFEPISLSDRQRDDLDVLNLLLVPWPLRLERRHFSLVRRDSEVAPPLPGPFRFFAFGDADEADDGASFEMWLHQTIARASDVARDLDGVVLPELALRNSRELERARAICARRGLMLITGVSHSDGTGLPSNEAVLDWSGLVDPDVQPPVIQQKKHHRWCLDRWQVIQYGLGSVIPASHDCWELSEIGPREVTFLTLEKWLTLCVLICEDLARQDPVADVMRAVGPNLLIALLMDGPQVRKRWPARYASVLSDDPGTSVLTLTSLGMSALSEPRDSTTEDRRRVIALWRDVMYGEQELTLPDDCECGVLSLVCKEMEEWTADGRSDHRHAYFPTFAGFLPIPGGKAAR